jgi:ABC-type glycerol-3-phosphate transport system permease component
MTLFFLFMSIVMLFPLLWAFSTSLKTDIDALVNSYSLIPLEGIHFENYREVFSIIPYLTYLSNTVYVSLITMASHS